MTLDSKIGSTSFGKPPPWWDAGRERFFVLSLFFFFVFFVLFFFFRTEYVVELIGMVTKSQPVLVLMEFMENGDLQNFLRKRRQGKISHVI